MIQIPFDRGGTTRAKCEVRVYGGWYEGTSITRLAEDINIELQRDFPKIIRLPLDDGGHKGVLVTAELAVALLQEPGHHLFNTYRRKQKAKNIRVKTSTDVGCIASDCILPLTKKLLQTSNCAKPGCGISDLIYRDEQKIVDTMLSCDLIHAARSGRDYIILISSDDDFLPPLRTVLLHGISAARFHTLSNGQRASFPQGGTTLFERDL